MFSRVKLMVRAVFLSATPPDMSIPQCYVQILLLSSTFALECMRMGASRDFMYSCASCFVSVFALQVWFSTTDPKKEVFLTAKLQNTFRTTGAA